MRVLHQNPHDSTQGKKKGEMKGTNKLKEEERQLTHSKLNKKKALGKGKISFLRCRRLSPQLKRGEDAWRRKEK